MPSQLETILLDLGLGELIPLFEAHEIDDSLLGELTDDDLQKIGIDKLGPRKRLLAAIAAGASRGSPTPRVKTDPALATKESPFINTLGLPFVPISGHMLFFCAWQLRVRDYQLYCQENAAEFPVCDFEQGPAHPVVSVTWNEACAFCRWLTKRERDMGWIGDDLAYRLPSDREWSIAVGLRHEPGATPLERSGKAKGYPWGTGFPPSRGAGNYHPSLAVDDFRETSPVGSFSANAFGIYDLGGNVWEWCQDEYERGSERRVLRGASCFNDDDEYLLSSYRDRNAPDNRRNNNGFRLVLATVKERDPWH